MRKAITFIRLKKLSNKKLLLLIGISALFLALTVAIVSVSTTKMIAKVTGDISSQFTRELNAQMNSHLTGALNHYFHELDIVFDMLHLMESPDTAKVSAFINQVRDNENITYLAFADTDGNLYDGNGTSLGTLKIRMLGRLLNGENNIVSDNETINGISLVLLGNYYTDPVTVGDKTLCIAIIGVSNELLSSEIVLNNPYSGGYSSVINADGSFVIKNSNVTYGGLNAFTILEQDGTATEADLVAIQTAIANGETYLYNHLRKDGSVVSYILFAPVEGTDWYTINTMPASFIRDSVTSLSANLTRISAALIALSAVICIVVVVLQSASERKLRINQIKLKEALLSAERASKSKTTFLFNMSHDIRTPMNAILGYTDIGLTHTHDEEQVTNSLNKIKVAGKHLLSLINDILEMSRIEAGKLELVEKELDIRKAIEGVDIMSKALAVPKSIDFQTVVGDIRNPYIFADELHINEVIINLISNAVKYTPDGGKVRYTVEQLGEADDGKATFKFEVTDTGIGMSEAFQQRLFDAFSRESNSTVSKTEGAGLGLSIVKKIVELAGGTVTAVSKQGEGSTFTVVLSFKVMNGEEIAEFEKTEVTEDAASHSELHLEGLKVLLVEDNEINREIAEMILSDFGIVVETAEDGLIAVNTLKEKGTDRYDFVLMDIQMPVMDGYAATKAIRALPGGDKVRIIALSANAFEEDKQKSIAVGMNAHVAKPLNTAELFEAMRQLS